MRMLRQVRSALSFLLTLFVFVPGALYLYLVLMPAAALFPARAKAWKAAFTKGMAHSLLAALRVGGASFHRVGHIPTDGPCVVVGNHQSLADPAVLISMSKPWVPAFVARKRYGKVPVVAESMRWANCPLIDPKRDVRGAVAAIAAAAARLEHGLLIFPEGHRTLDGEVRPFRAAGLIAILTTRRMPVYLAVSDGLWVNRRLVDFVFNVHKMRGRTEILGPFAPPEDPAAIPAFIDWLRDTMVGHLAQMRQRNERATELAAAVRARVLPPDPSPEAVALARHIVEMAGDSVAAIVFFGSRKSRARPDPYSAFDLFVVIEPARAFYERLAAHGSVRRAPGLLAALQAVLPPNQILLAAGAGDGAPRAKCAVITADDLRRQTSPRRDDHFCLGRLFQPTEILYAAPGREAEIVAALVEAHAFTYRWGRPWLPARFDVGEYCRTLLRVSFAAEIRPEPEGRAQALFEAQEAYLRPVYATLLAALAASGELREQAPGVYSLVRPVGAFERLRLAAYFRWSKLRATVRWAKYVITFDDWLDFIVRKVRRHTGEDIVLSDRERRMPLLFLWPRLIHYLRHKDRARP